MWIQARLEHGAGPVLAPRDRQRDPVVGVCPRCGRERYGWGRCLWVDCEEMAQGRQKEAVALQRGSGDEAAVKRASL